MPAPEVPTRETDEAPPTEPASGAGGSASSGASPSSSGSLNSPRRDRTPTGLRRSSGALRPPERLSLGSRVAVRVGLSAVVWGGLAGLGMAALLAALGFRDPLMLSMVVAASLAAGAAAFVAVRRVFARRLTRVASFVEQRVRGGALGDESSDELERVELAVDRLLETMERPGRGTPHAGIERIPSAEQSHREAILARDLTTKTAELAQRLEERNVLFDVLRESAASQSLENVLSTLVERLGPVLRLREAAVLLRKSDDSFVIEAAWGFSDPKLVLGRAIRAGEGVTGGSTEQNKAVLIEDVTQSPEYMAFWGEVRREGSFLSVPIQAAGKTIGALALTRPPEDPLTPTESRYVSAIADQVALAIHNAQLFQKLEELSTTDELTRLPNRRYFNERLARELSQAKRWGHPVSVLVIDIDHFKKLNDREGHAAGDEALVAVAQVLRGTLREVDVVARWGGEEFVVILDRTSETDAISVGDKLRHAVEAIEIAGSKEQPGGRITVSIGAAELQPGEDAAALVQRADRAVYQAKKAGRNRVSIPPC